MLIGARSATAHPEHGYYVPWVQVPHPATPSTKAVGPAASSLRGDFNGDCAVDFQDFLDFATAFGKSGSEVAEYDLEPDGVIDFSDFLTFASVFGDVCEDGGEPVGDPGADPVDSLPQAALEAAKQATLDIGYPQSMADALTLDASLAPLGYGSGINSASEIRVEAGAPPSPSRTIGNVRVPLDVSGTSEVILKWVDGSWVVGGEANHNDDAELVWVDNTVTLGNTYTYASVIVFAEDGGYNYSPPFSVTIDEAAVAGIDKIRVLALVSGFTESEFEVTKAQVEAIFQNIQTLYDELSYGNAELAFTVVDIGRTDLEQEPTLDLAQTLDIIFEAYQQHQSFVYGQPCDFDTFLPIAQQTLDSLTDFNNIWGYDIDTLSVSAARAYKCDKVGGADLLARHAGIPGTIDLHRYDVLVTVPFADDSRGGAYANRVYASGLTQGGEPVTALLKYVHQPIDPGLVRPLGYGHITEVEENPRVQADQYTEGQPPLTRFSQALAHELIHALEVGTHANGVDFYMSQENADLFRGDPLTAIADIYSEYGDEFDLIGGATYGVGLAAEYRTFLGWLTSDRIVEISSSQTDVRVNGLNSTTGIAAAKILVSGGWIHVTYRPTVGYDESMKLPELAANTQGAMVHFVRDTGFPLNSSYLIDASGTVSDITFALQPGETFTLYGATISNVRVEDDHLKFDVAM